MPYHLTTIALVWLAGSLVLIPLMILAVRLAIIPLVDAIAGPARVRPGHAFDTDRLTRLEERMADLARELDRRGSREAAPGVPER